MHQMRAITDFICKYSQRCCRCMTTCGEKTFNPPLILLMGLIIGFFISSNVKIPSETFRTRVLDAKVGSISPPPSYLRHLTSEAIDSVVADPSVAKSAELASALAWTRKREAKIQRQANHLRAEVEQLRLQTAQLENVTITEFKHRKDGFCTKSGSSLRLLTSEDAAFEDNGKSSRLDGVAQISPIRNKFIILMCVHEDSMSGVLRIQKQFNCNENTQFTKDASYESLIRTKFGPDEFIVGLEGPELHSLVPGQQYRGHCTYDLPFLVTTPGLYHLKLIWLRENYIAAREGTVGWLPGHVDKPLGERFFINLSYSTDDGETDRILRRHQKGYDLPACDLRSKNYSYIPGRWIFKGNQSGEIFYHKNPVYPRDGAYTWVRLEHYTWMPTLCALPKFSHADAFSCLQDKKILFEGDSHMRMLFSSLMTFLCGKQEAWSGWSSQCGGNCQRGMEKVCMRKDGTASSPSFMDTSADLTFINFGQHFCDGEHHLTFRDYQLHVDRVMQKITALSASRRSHVIWHESNMMPFRKDEWVRGFGDQRTNIKLAAYNQYATLLMKRNGIPVIPAFAQTMALSAGTADDAHIPIELLAESTLKFVLAFACE